MKKQFAIAFIAVVILLLVIAARTHAKADTLSLCYIGQVEVSAYHPYEDSCQNNYKGTPLSVLVGDIVAAPTGSDLLGKYVLLVYQQDGEDIYLLRQVLDTGCKKGRLDLLVSDDAAMRAWGLRDCEVYVLDSAPKSEKRSKTPV